MSREYKNFPLRVSPELREKLENAAQNNNRSITGEIVARLEESLQATQSSADAVFKAVLSIAGRLNLKDADIAEYAGVMLVADEDEKRLLLDFRRVGDNVQLRNTILGVAKSIGKPD